ncbi:UNVERIFIED_CONTAM: hypothetical protein NCL1_48641 [Trichonephila clavipes]
MLASGRCTRSAMLNGVTVCQVYWHPSGSAHHLRGFRQSKKRRSKGTNDPTMLAAIYLPSITYYSRSEGN